MKSCDLIPQLLERVDLKDGITREKVVIQVEPDIFMPMYILIPKTVRQGEIQCFMAIPGHQGTEIKADVFRNCSSLTSITIPDSVTSIGVSAFSGCTSLKEVYCEPITPPSGRSGMFDDNASGRKIYVPRNSVEAYKAAQYWSNYASSIEGYDF